LGEEVGSGIIVVTAEEIIEMNVRNIVELLNRIPGVNAGSSSVSLQGSSMVRVLLDGRSINNPLSGHRSVKWSLVSINDIEKIEIYKGGGTVFGDDGSGGVILIKTKKLDEGKGIVEIFGGNFDTLDYNVSYRKNIEPFGIGLSAGRYKTGGFRENDDEEERRAAAKLSYSPSEDYSYDLSMDFASEDSGRPGLPAFPTPRSRYEGETFGSSLICRMRDLKSDTHFSHFRSENRNPDSGLETILNGWSLSEGLKRKIAGIGTGANFEVSEVSGNKVDTRQEEEYGIYLTKDYSFEGVPLTLNGGLRWTYYSEFDHAVNPEIKLGFNKNDFGALAAVTKTNNTPTPFQRYYESSSTLPNPDLGMEKAMNYSVTFSYNPEKQFESNIIVFYNKVKDRITYVRGESGTGRYENFGKVTLEGAEISCKWKPLALLEMSPSYTYLSAKDDETGRWLPCKPRHRMKFDMRYKPVTDLSLNLNTEYVSKQYSRSDNTESVSEYFVADIRADYYWGDIRLFAEIDNVFDRDYMHGDGYPASPLAWKIGLSYEF
jgi:iron complex outermembrane receptor protein